MSPLVGCSRPRIIRASVVFPDPDSPMIVKISDGVGRQREIGIDDGIDIATRELAAHDEALGDVGDLEQRGHSARPRGLLGPIRASGAHVGAAPARRAMIQPDRLEWRHLGLALLDGERATRVKAAARGRFGKVGRSSLERRFGRGVTDAWQGGDQMGGVRMPWCGKERARRRLFHEPSGVHDADAVGGVGVHAHVVGDEHHGRPHLALHVADHRQHVLLHHHVERRGRFVGDDELGLTHRGQGDRHPLAHPAGQLVRIGGQDVGGQTETLKVRFDPAPELTAGQPHRPEREVLERPANPPHRIEQAHRPLHDVGEMLPPERIDLRLGCRVGIDVAVLEVVGHRSADDSQRWTNRGGKRLDQRGLARRALAGDAIDLVLANRERDVIDRPHLAVDAEVLRPVIGLQAVDGQNVLWRGGHQLPMRRRRERGSMYSLSDTASR